MGTLLDVFNKNPLADQLDSENDQRPVDPTDRGPFLKSPTKPKDSTGKKILKNVGDFALKTVLNTPQGKIGKSIYDRISPKLDSGISGPMSNLDEMTQLRKSQDDSAQSYQTLKKTLAQQQLPYDALNVLGAASGKLSQRPPQQLAPPVGFPLSPQAAPFSPQPPTPATPSKIPYFPTSSNSAPRGDIDKFSAKGAKDYLRRQDSSAGQKPGWVNEGADALKSAFHLKRKANPFDAPDAAPANLKTVSKAGKDFAADRQYREFKQTLSPSEKMKSSVNSESWLNYLTRQAKELIQ